MCVCICERVRVCVCYLLIRMVVIRVGNKSLELPMKNHLLLLLNTFI